MKNKLFLIPLFVLIGCSLELTENNYEGIMNNIFSNLNAVHDEKSNWKTPEETIEEGGDCEDYALLMLKIVKDTYDVKGELVIIEYYDGILEGKCHAITLFEGRYYDPMFNISYISLPDYSKVFMKLSYDIAMFLAKNNGIQEMLFY